MPTTNPVRKPTKDDALALEYAGMMGHEYAVTSEHKGHRVCKGECNDAETARKWASEAPNGTAYVRTPNGWRVLPPELEQGQ